MTGDRIESSLHLADDLVAVPSSGLPNKTGLAVLVRAKLDGAYRPAQLAYARAVQVYAERLAVESENQEESERAPGVASKEITESAVIRARDALDKKVALQLRKRSPLDPYALAGSPIFAGATGVMGSYLHSLVQVIVFSVLAAMGVLCILHLARRGMP